MKKQNVRKLMLNRDTLLALDPKTDLQGIDRAADLKEILGGQRLPTGWYTCD